MDDSKGLAYFFMGLGVGVAVGMLFAPQSGEETRGLIKSKAGESGEYLRRRSEELRDQANELVDRGKDAVYKQREQFSAALDAGKQAYRDAVSQAERNASTGAEAL